MIYFINLDQNAMKKQINILLVLLFFFSAVAMAQKTVTGTVIDASGEPIIGATIMDETTHHGGVTDINGHFSLLLTEGSNITVSSIGYNRLTAKVHDGMKIVMKEMSKEMKEIVVVGYGTQKKVNLTGAVSTVSIDKSLESRSTNDVAKALQGVVPGLTIVNSSGRLDANPTISIRGTGTLSNSATSTPLYVVDGVPMDDISFLNSLDIQSISVLKDAASCSIYGTRAAFGVVLITTKSAKKGDHVRIDYSNNFAWQTPTILPDYPDVPTQIRAITYANKRAGLQNELFGMQLDELLDKAVTWEQKHGYQKASYREMVEGEDFDINAKGAGLYYADWDVKNIMFRKWKPAQTHNLSINGASDKTTYNISFGYNHNEGVMKFNNDDIKKHNASINISTDVTSWLTLGGRFSYSKKDYTAPYTLRNSYQYLWRWGSFFPLGTYNGYDMRNDIAYRKQAADDETADSYTRIGGFLKATITKGLTLNADYTYNVRNLNEKRAAIPVTGLNSWGGNITSATTFSTTSWVDMTTERDKSYALNIYANYSMNLRKNHHFNLMAGANAEEGDNMQQYSQRYDLLDYNKPEFNLATGNQYASGWHKQWGTCGYFGRINYDYKGIYLAELNGRYDGSSRFPQNNHWAFFPSASLGYRISEEGYFDYLRNYINNMKLRLSYGEIGNQEIGENQFLEVISKVDDSNVHWLDDNGKKVVEYNMPTLAYSKLKWERIQTLDFGIDLSLLNEVNITFDWYQRTTKDMLAPSKTLPAVLGTDEPLVNAGTLRTRGWELSMDWRHQFNDINVYANFNITDYKTVVTRWDNDSRLLNSNYSGMTYGDIWGFETDRYFTASDFKSDGSYADGVASQKGLQQGNFVYGPGDIKFKDLDGNGVINGGKGTAEDHGDLKVIGNTQPRYQYSFRLGGSWRGFDVDMFFQGVGKRSVWTISSFVIPFSQNPDALYSNQTSYWTEENPDPNADYPRLYPSSYGQGTIAVIGEGRYNFYPQSKYLVNMAYLRFKTLTIGYSLPKSIIKKAFLEKLRVYFSAENLCELINRSKAPVDPEINSADKGVSLSIATWGRTDPMYRTISFGVQLTF